MNWEIETLDELESVAEDLLKQLKPGMIYGLEGGLGAGKTTLVSAIMKQLGNDEVSSPTFTIVQRYDTKPKVFHMDLYRLETEDALEMLDLDYYFDNKDAYFFVEWPERLRLIDVDYTPIQIKKVKQKRLINLAPKSPKGDLKHGR